MSTIYFVFGIMQLIAGYITYVFYTQENFRFDLNDYKNIGKNKENIVVYFQEWAIQRK